MLECNVEIQALTDQALGCGGCRLCAGRSKLNYPFQRDLFNSDDLVREIMRFIKDETGLFCEKTTVHKNPDINVFRDKDCTDLVCRIEAKYLGGQAFMASKRSLGLYPKETLVVDEPKLKSYFRCKEDDRAAGRDIPIYVVWKLDRPCADVGGIAVYQEIDVLRQIWSDLGARRAFHRETAASDFKQGCKMGIVDKYHFSLRECLPIEQLIGDIQALG